MIASIDRALGIRALCRRRRHGRSRDADGRGLFGAAAFDQRVRRSTRWPSFAAVLVATESRCRSSIGVVLTYGRHAGDPVVVRCDNGRTPRSQRRRWNVVCSMAFLSRCRLIRRRCSSMFAASVPPGPSVSRGRDSVLARTFDRAGADFLAIPLMAVAHDRGMAVSCNRQSSSTACGPQRPDDAHPGVPTVWCGPRIASVAPPCPIACGRSRGSPSFSIRRALTWWTLWRRR